MMIRCLEHSLLYFAKHNEMIVGFANFSFVKEEGNVELAAIYLYTEHQGKRIGSALLQEGINHSQDTKEVSINVKKNVIGKTFYEAYAKKTPIPG